MEAYPAKVVGLPYEGRLKYARANINAGDKIDLILEPDNPVSNEAVAAYHRQVKIGYIPKKEHWIFESLADGNHLAASACRLSLGSQNGITLLIFVCHGKSSAAFETSRAMALKTFAKEVSLPLKKERNKRLGWFLLIVLAIVVSILTNHHK